MKRSKWLGTRNLWPGQRPSGNSRSQSPLRASPSELLRLQVWASPRATGAMHARQKRAFTFDLSAASHHRPGRRADTTGKVWPGRVSPMRPRDQGRAGTADLGRWPSTKQTTSDKQAAGTGRLHGGSSAALPSCAPSSAREHKASPGLSRSSRLRQVPGASPWVSEGFVLPGEPGTGSCVWTQECQRHSADSSPQNPTRLRPSWGAHCCLLTPPDRRESCP